MVNDFVDSILAVDPSAAIIVLGDLNDFDFSTPLTTVEGGVLTSLVETLAQAQRYSFVFEGNAQTLDHVLVSGGLVGDVSFFDIVHVNAEFAVQASDHDPLVAQICADANAPSLSVSLSRNVLFPPNHKYVAVTASVNVSDSVDPDPSLTLVSVTSNEPDMRRATQMKHRERHRGRHRYELPAPRRAVGDRHRAGLHGHVPGDRRLRELDSQERDGHRSGEELREGIRPERSELK